MNRYLLSDIAEMLETPEAAPAPHRDGGLLSIFEFQGMRVTLTHDDLESTTIRVSIISADWRRFITDSTIHDCFNGELVAEFIQSVAVRNAELVEVK
jgi:hypothetical protein